MPAPVYLRTIELIPTRRPAGKVRIQLGPKNDPTDIFKDRAVFLLEALNAYHSHRAGYCLTPEKADAFVRLYRGGWNASRRFMANSREPYHFFRYGKDAKHSLKEALLQCRQNKRAPRPSTNAKAGRVVPLEDQPRNTKRD